MSGPNPELAQALGQIGLDAAARYGQSAASGDLQAAIEALEDAYAEDPDSDHPLAWWWTLATAYGIRGSAEDRVDDVDEAVDMIEQIVRNVEPEHPLRDPAISALADLYWERRRHRPDPGVVDRLGTLAGQATGQATRQLVLVYLGIALSIRYSEAGDASDLDATIAALEPALTGLLALREAGAEMPDEATDGVLAMGDSTLAQAYLDRGRPGDLDRCIAVARAAFDRYPAEVRLRTGVSQVLAGGHDERWQEREAAGLPGAAADLDAAIDAWTAAGEEGWTGPDIDGARGGLLVFRADRRDDDNDARLGIDLLATAATTTTDPTEGVLCRTVAAAASRLRWEITGDLARLVTAADYADLALTGDPAGAELLDAQRERLLAEHFLSDNGHRRGPAGAATSRLAEVVADSIGALARATAAPRDQRAEFALLLALAAFGTGDEDGFSLDPIRDLLAVAGTARDVGPSFWAHLDFARGMVDQLDEALDPRPGQGRAVGSLARAARAARAAALPDELRDRIRYGLMLALRMRGGVTGNRRDTGTARRLITMSQPPPEAEGRRIRSIEQQREDPLFDCSVEVAERLRASDPDAVRKLVDAVAEHLDDDGDPHQSAYLRAARALADPATGPMLGQPPEDLGTGLGAIPARIAAFTTGTALAVQALTRNDHGTALSATEYVERQAALVPVADRRLAALAAANAGQLRLMLAENTEEPGHHAGQAREHLRRAVDGIDGPHDPAWPRIAMGSALAARLVDVPDLGSSREWGMAALRGHAWQVMAQAGTDDALASATAAAATARQIALWCLDDRHTDPGAVEHLVAALDAGRALVLRASTADRTVPDLLRARGADELAGEWEATTGLGRDLLTGAVAAAGTGIPDELRLEVLNVLGDQAVDGFVPITTAQIGAALSRHRRDALVYLIAGEDAHPGAAVIIDAAGEVTVLDLPRLRSDDETPLPRSSDDAAGNRDLEPLPRTRPADLDRLCAWAWDAAMGAVLDALPGRQPRVYLVPIGVLTTVPWHTAYTQGPDRRRFAVERAVISYAPSAKILCGLGGERPAPDITSALVVGNPTGDLPYAGDEAAALHREFYPTGAYFGLPAAAADAAGSPGDVLDWIDRHPAGPALAHFACHGSADPAHPADAHLVLAGGALSVRTLLDRARSAALDLDQVFLAACATGPAATNTTRRSV